ncbi:MAG: methionine adenosyltransferase [Acidobacteriota bacterium]|jgi:S-adenosylmethionine synthetase
MADVTRILTAESVTEGHPDKVCDLIVDRVLDAHLKVDPHARVACEALCKGDAVILLGEISSSATIDAEAVVRTTVADVGYDDDDPFSAAGLTLHSFLSAQSAEIARAVSRIPGHVAELRAGDQGIMIGYASDETPELMPLPILLAHRLTATSARDRKRGSHAWMRPDGKAQVSVRYQGDAPEAVTEVVVSLQHAAEVGFDTIRAYVVEDLAPRALGAWNRAGIRFHVNPSGSFVLGGPAADSGLSGRKIIVDTYGPTVPHGGGSFSGKDPTKVDRTGAYFARWAARQIVRERIARRAQVQVAYAIGEAEPLALSVETFGTGRVATARAFAGELDFRPAAMIERLDLRRPIYSEVTNYGHFGRVGVSWEEP